MLGPCLVQTRELSERPRLRSIPALPGRLTIGAPQLKLCESRSSLSVPTRFLWSIIAIGQLSNCNDGGAGADNPIVDAEASEAGAAILGTLGFIRRASLRSGRLRPGGPWVKRAPG